MSSDNSNKGKAVFSGPGIFTEQEVDDNEYDDLSDYFNAEDIGLIDTVDGEMTDEPVLVEAVDIAENIFNKEPQDELPAEPDSGDETPSTPAFEEEKGHNPAEEEKEPSEGPEKPSEEPSEELSDSPKKKRRERRKKTEDAPGEPGPESMPGEETDGSETKKKGKGAGRIVVTVLIVLLLAALAFGFVRFVLPLLGGNNDDYSVISAGGKVSNGTVEVTIDEVEVLGSMLTYQFDPDYVYIAVRYTFKNVSGTQQGWEATPYMMLRPFSVEGETARLLEADSEDAERLLTIWKSLGITEEPEENIPVEIVPEAPADGVSPDESGQTEASGTEASETASEEAAAEEEEEDPLKDIYGSFDFEALQFYSLEMGIDYSDAKQPLAAGAVRSSADVLKIRRELFETGMYYICMDNQKAAVYIDPTPVDIDSGRTESAPDAGTETDNGTDTQTEGSGD